VTQYSLILFLHVAAALGLFASLSFELLSLPHLRRASELSEVRRWIDPVPRLPLVATTSILVVFFSGIFLTVRMFAFDTAWPKVTIGALLLIAPLGAVSGKRMRVIRRNSAEASTMKPDLLRRVRDPFLKISLGIRIAVFFGIVLLMTAKPELWPSIGIMVCSVVLGLLLSLLRLGQAEPFSVRREFEG
jgi:hypothetical protein